MMINKTGTSRLLLGNYYIKKCLPCCSEIPICESGIIEVVCPVPAEYINDVFGCMCLKGEERRINCLAIDRPVVSVLKRRVFWNTKTHMEKHRPSSKSFIYDLSHRWLQSSLGGVALLEYDENDHTSLQPRAAGF